MQAGGPSNPVADTPKNRPKEPKEKQPPDTGRQGAIKSIETFTVKQKAEATGVTQEEQKTETTKTEEVNTDTDKETDITEKPAADPYRWRYIFGILVLLAVAFFLSSEDEGIYGCSRLLPQIVLAEIKESTQKGLKNGFLFGCLACKTLIVKVVCGEAGCPRVRGPKAPS